METTQTLIVGAGISGLATAAALEEKNQKNYKVFEADADIGGYCKTIHQDGFVWDYSGHFFHFKHPEIEGWLRARMPGQNIRTVEKKSFIHYEGRRIDFPFQKNIHQLPQNEFIECLVELYFSKPSENESNFKEMLYGRLGKGISEKFLIPYNEKLYACDLSTLDKEAMGRFFPKADFHDVMSNMRQASSQSYNATFTYPEGGAYEYVKALASAVNPSALHVAEPLVSVDVNKKVARTTRREIQFEQMVSSVPFPKLLSLCQIPFDSSKYSWNKVLVFNLGFDSKGPKDVHWMYYPNKDISFYRVGFYDNIFDAARMSLYVELGFSKDAKVDVPFWRQRVLDDLKKAGVVTQQNLVAEHHVVMDPAYVHITQTSLAEFAKENKALQAKGVHSIGRYGGWTYCSIEDNIVEARACVERLTRQHS